MRGQLGGGGCALGAEEEPVMARNLSGGEFLNARQRSRDLPNLFSLNDVALQEIKVPPDPAAPRLSALQGIRGRRSCAVDGGRASQSITRNDFIALCCPLEQSSLSVRKASRYLTGKGHLQNRQANEREPLEEELQTSGGAVQTHSAFARAQR